MTANKLQGGAGYSPPILRDEKADGRFWLIVWGASSRGAARRAVCYREYGGLYLRRSCEERRECARRSVVGGEEVRGRGVVGVVWVVWSCVALTRGSQRSSGRHRGQGQMMRVVLLRSGLASRGGTGTGTRSSRGSACVKAAGRERQR